MQLDTTLHRGIFFPQLIDDMGLKRGVEVGVKQGVFSEVLLKKSRLSFLASVDIWDVPKDLQIATEKLAKYGERSRMIQQPSVEAAKCFDDGFFDFIYIDANHTYEKVAEDLHAWWPKLGKGVFAGHDYMKHTTILKYDFGVIEAVNEFAEQHGLGIYTCQPAWKSWYMLKK